MVGKPQRRRIRLDEIVKRWVREIRSHGGEWGRGREIFIFHGIIPAVYPFW